MDIETFRELGVEIVKQGTRTNIHFDPKGVSARIQQFLCRLYRIDPHNYLVVPNSEQTPELIERTHRLRAKQDGVIENSERGFFAFLTGILDVVAYTYYTADVDLCIPLSKKPDYVILFARQVEPIDYFLTLAEEITHGEHACYHIGRTVTNHREYSENFSIPDRECVASLSECYLVSRLGIPYKHDAGEEHGAYGEHALGYKTGEKLWKKYSLRLSEEEVRFALSDTFKKAPKEIKQLLTGFS